MDALVSVAATLAFCMGAYLGTHEPPSLWVVACSTLLMLIALRIVTGGEAHSTELRVLASLMLTLASVPVGGALGAVFNDEMDD